MPEMLSKEVFKACLAGEPIPAVPAWRFWFDGKFSKAHRDEIIKMEQRWCDDFARFDCTHTVRAIPRDDLPDPGLRAALRTSPQALNRAADILRDYVDDVQVRGD